MIERIIVENFMAHERTELELGPGVTALTGPNNTGKSALVEALRCVAENPTPSHYIRHGAKEARVTVVLSDGHRVTWIRKKASAGYEILAPGSEEPESFWKLGRGGVPEEVRSLLRMNRVDLDDGNPVDVHIGDQREPVFLLNRPDRAVADFLASSSEGAHLLSMQGALKRRTLEARRESAGREARLRDIEAELDALAPLPDIHLMMETAGELEQRSQALSREIPALERLIAERDTLKRELDRANRERGLLEQLGEPAALEPLHPLRSLIDEQLDLRHRSAFAAAYAETLVLLAEPPTPTDTAGIRAVMDELIRTGAELEAARTTSSALADLAPPPPVEELSALSKMVEELTSYSSQMQILNEYATTASALREPPQPEDESALAGLLTELGEVRKGMEREEKALEATRRDLMGHATYLRERLEAIGRCPTCGGELESGEFLGGEHAHESGAAEDAHGH
jgi:exonuclease SbcC